MKRRLVRLDATITSPSPTAPSSCCASSEAFSASRCEACQGYAERVSLGSMALGVAMTGVFVLVIAALVVGCSPVWARTFGGYECPDGDCSDHAVGFRWAQQNEVTDPTDCPGSKSATFQEG